MEGTNPDIPPAPAPTPRTSRKRLMLVLIVALVVVASVISIYVLTPSPPVPLEISDGSTTGVIEGNLTTFDAARNPLVLNFKATTYANETDGPASTLTLRLVTWTYFDGVCGCAVVNVNATVVGSLAASLHPASLRFVVNQTGPTTEVQGWGPGQGTNLSIDYTQSLAFVNNGSGAVTATILRHAGQTCNFTYSEYSETYANETPSVQYNHFLGFRATVTGSFTPDVSVGILLKVIDVPGGIWA